VRPQPVREADPYDLMLGSWQAAAERAWQAQQAGMRAMARDLGYWWVEDSLVLPPWLEPYLRRELEARDGA
jgi:hypothetical protein